MIVSKRLSTIIDTISTDILCDIGTDHAYIPIEAMKRGKITEALACDVNKDPLTIGENNIKSKGYDDKIKVRLSNGLNNVNIGECTTCTICGMGGFLILDILKNSVKVAKSFEQLILQPQSDIDKVRKYVLSIGFVIKEEKYIFDNEKFYIILNCIKGSEKKYSEKELLCGRNISKDSTDIYLQYIKYEYDKCTRVLKRLQNLEDVREKKNLFTKKLKWYGEVLNCI